MKARNAFLITAALTVAGAAFRKVRRNMALSAARRKRRLVLSQGLRSGRLAAAIAGVTVGGIAAFRAARS